MPPKQQRHFGFALLIAGAFASATPLWAGDLSRLVDTRIGTGFSPTATSGGTSERRGNTQPTAGVPFGMVQFGPDTDQVDSATYTDEATLITGFSLTHLSGPGCEGAGEISILPLLRGDNPLAENFGHADEKTLAGYYSVRFENDVTAELTATARVGFARFAYPEDSWPQIRIDTISTASGSFNGDLEVVDSRHVRGWVEGGGFCDDGPHYKVYYSIELDTPIAAYDTSSAVTMLTFEPNGAPISLKVGISYVSEANAAANLAGEGAAFDFDTTRALADAQWEQALEHIRAEGGTERERRIFYTALYHSFLHPNLTSDVNGDYMGFDEKLHSVTERAGQGAQYANFSGWDIYRSQIQLLALLDPHRTGDIAQSLVNDGAQCGALPKWADNNVETGVMVGDPGPIEVASAYAFGATGFDTSRALSLMQASGLVPGTHCNESEIRPGLEDYLKMGFVPFQTGFFSDNGAASVTLEYASSDFAISRFATALGRDDLARTFAAHSSSWTNLLDPSTLYIRPRFDDPERPQWLKSPKWEADFDPSWESGFVEGNSSQYTWMVPFDGAGLIARIGGPQAARERLDAFFESLNSWQESPHYWIGNEPGFATPWLYNWAGAPEKAQQVLSRIMTEDFSDDAGGLPGNDDLGATSSWYVWAAIGLYPAIPGVAGFAVSQPHFSNIEIIPEGGQPISLTATGGGSPSNVIQSVELGDSSHSSHSSQQWKSSWISLPELQKAHALHFRLGSESAHWATLPDELPPSFGQ